MPDTALIVAVCRQQPRLQVAHDAATQARQIAQIERQQPTALRLDLLRILRTAQVLILDGHTAASILSLVVAAGAAIDVAALTGIVK